MNGNLCRRLRVFLLPFLIAAAVVLLPGTKAHAAKKTMPEETAFSSPEEENENYEAAKGNLDHIYYSALDEMTDTDGPLSEDMPFSKWLYIRFFRAYRALREAAPYICAASIFAGVFMCVLGRKSLAFVRFALVWFVFAIPFTTLFIIFAVGASPLFKS